MKIKWATTKLDIKKKARKKDGKSLQKNPSSPNFGLRACAN